MRGCSASIQVMAVCISQNHGVEIHKLKFLLIFGVCEGNFEQYYLCPKPCSTNSVVIPTAGRWYTVPVE